MKIIARVSATICVALLASIGLSVEAVGDSSPRPTYCPDAPAVCGPISEPSASDMPSTSPTPPFGVVEDTPPTLPSEIPGTPMVINSSDDTSSTPKPTKESSPTPGLPSTGV